MSNNENNKNNQNLQDLINSLSKHLGTNPDQLKDSVQHGDISRAIKNLDPNDAKKIEKVLSDKDAAKKILSTKKAQELLKKFLGEK